MKNLVLALSISLMGQFAVAQGGLKVIEGAQALEALVNAPKASESAIAGLKTFSEAAGVSVQTLTKMTAAERSALVNKVGAKKGGVADLANLTHFQSAVKSEAVTVKGGAQANNLVDASLNAKSGGSLFKADAGFTVGSVAKSAEIGALKNAKEIAEIDDPAIQAIKIAEATDQFELASELQRRGAPQIFNESLEAQCSIGKTELEVAQAKADITKGVKNDVLANKAIDDVAELTDTYIANHGKRVQVSETEATKSTVELAENCDVLKPAIGMAAKAKLLL